MVVELDRGTRLVGAALVMPGLTKHSEPAAASATPLHNLAGAIWFSGEMRSHHGHDLGALRKRADKRNTEGT
jgi:hypothetical protein